jgi:flagellar assembly factor FliW
MTPSASAGSALLSMPNEYLVRSDLLGAFTISPASAIEFPEGLLGFEDARRFALVRAGTDSVYWLQSLDAPSLLFLLVDPFPHFIDYVVDIPPRTVQELAGSDICDASDVVVFTIVTLPPTQDATMRATTNLQGPIVINLRSRRGRQIICNDTEYGVRCPIVLAPER